MAYAMVQAAYTYDDWICDDKVNGLESCERRSVSHEAVNAVDYDSNHASAKQRRRLPLPRLLFPGARTRQDLVPTIQIIITSIIIIIITSVLKHTRACLASPAPQQPPSGHIGCFQQSRIRQ